MIEIYADTANLESLKQAKANPLVKGFTTNPTLMASAGISDYEDFAHRAIDIVEGLPISFEVFSDDLQEMERQARKIASWGSNINVKIPITNTKGQSCAPLVRKLADSGIRCNVTAIFTQQQIDAVMAEINHNDYVILSIFAGRIADTSISPNTLFSQNRHIRNAILLWASPREVFNIVQADAAGAHIITVSPDLLKKHTEFYHKNLVEYSLDTVKMFYNDAKKSGFTL